MFVSSLCRRAFSSFAARSSKTANNLFVDLAIGNTISKVPAQQARLARTGQKKTWKYELYVKQLHGKRDAIKQINFFPDITNDTYLPPSYAKKDGPPFITQHDCWRMSTARLDVTLKDGTTKILFRRLRTNGKMEFCKRLRYKQHRAAGNRAFGVELELVAPIKPGKVRDAIQRVTGTKSLITGHNNKTMKAWKVETDTTIAALKAQYGLEIVSPILRGEGGLDLISKVANELSTCGSTANSSCGLHVHIDMTGVKFEQLKLLCQAWVKYEEGIDLLLPPSRRASANKYCLNVGQNKKFRNLSNKEAHTLIERQTTKQGLVKVMNSHPTNRNRYFKLNLQNLVSKDKPRNTIEFRGPAGTCDAAVVENWVRFFMSFVEASIHIKEVEPFGEKAKAPKIRKGLFAFVKNPTCTAFLQLNNNP